ncbi:hypothetical protein [Actinacidiphila glaucinigra]|uniref:hypothetical protein n=1 Tax=Actinacidiphila glaucinigra TaxID=235986 RepID=UPI0035E352D3
MTGRRRKPSEPVVEPGRPILLDWKGPGHYSATAKPCRYCGSPTHLRDSKGKPADKVCAEAALAQQAAEATAAYRKDTL